MPARRRRRRGGPRPAARPAGRAGGRALARGRQRALIRAITGSPVDAALQSAGLAWLAEQRAEALDRAASAFTAKDCVYFWCTGERATDAAAAAAAFGDWRTGAYDARVIELLGLRNGAHLLPEIIDGTRDHGELKAAAAAALGLIAGTPVVLAPVDTVAVALALGLGGRDEKIGGSVLGSSYAHMRVFGDAAAAERAAGDVAIMPLPLPGHWLGVARHGGMANVDWLIGMAEQLVVDAGLIGLARGDLRATLERGAAEAAAAAPRYRPFAGDADGTPPSRASRAVPASTTCCARFTRGWPARRATAMPRSAWRLRRCASLTGERPARRCARRSPHTWGPRCA